jgi:hypothetical protein
MTSWRDVEQTVPELAAAVRAPIAGRKHATMATVRRDGGPRISGTELDFADDGEIYLGMTGGARRAADLRRDPRIAVHCPTVDPPEGNPAGWPGEGKVSGRAVPQPDQDGAHFFRIDIEQIVLTRLNAAGDEMEISDWRVGEAVRVHHRA